MILDGFRLTDEVAIVTGGGRGLGRAIALGLAGAGAKRAISSRTEAEPREVKREIEDIGHEALAVPADVSAENDVKRLVDTTCAAKGGVEQLTKVLALEWAQHNVRVNALAPAFVETAMTAGLRDSERLHHQILEDTPVGRLPAPEEVVGVAIFLSSEHSGYVTGQIIYVDGGWTAR